MQKKLTLSLILILVLAQLCACGKPQAETSPAAESEAAAPAELPAEETPADSDEPDDTPSRTPERVLTSTKYTAEVYVETVQYEQYQIESREYAVSDGVSATLFQAPAMAGLFDAPNAPAPAASPKTGLSFRATGVAHGHDALTPGSVCPDCGVTHLPDPRLLSSAPRPQSEP